MFQVSLAGELEFSSGLRQHFLHPAVCGQEPWLSHPICVWAYGYDHSSHGAGWNDLQTQNRYEATLSQEISLEITFTTEIWHIWTSPSITLPCLVADPWVLAFQPHYCSLFPFPECPNCSVGQSKITFLWFKTSRYKLCQCFELIPNFLLSFISETNTALRRAPSSICLLVLEFCTFLQIYS